MCEPPLVYVEAGMKTMPMQESIISKDTAQSRCCVDRMLSRQFHMRKSSMTWTNYPRDQDASRLDRRDHFREKNMFVVLALLSVQPSAQGKNSLPRRRGILHPTLPPQADSCADYPEAPVDRLAAVI